MKLEGAVNRKVHELRATVVRGCRFGPVHARRKRCDAVRVGCLVQLEAARDLQVEAVDT